MENTLFNEDNDSLVMIARERLLLLDRQSNFDVQHQRQYQDCLNCLQRNGTYLYHSADELADLSEIFISDQLLDFLGDYSRLKSILSHQGLKTMDQLFAVDRKTFLSWPRCSHTKWNIWLSLRDAVWSKRKELVVFFQTNYVKKVFPILEDNRTYSLAEKFDLMVEQYLFHLKEYASFHPDVQETVKRMRMILAIKAKSETILEKLKVTSERLRQIKEKYLSQLSTGWLEEIPHLCVDVNLIEKIKNLDQVGPRYKSVSWMNDFLGCSDYQETHIPPFISMKKLYEEGKKGSYNYFDQPYFLPQEESVESIRLYVSSMVKVMGMAPDSEIRPMSRAEILNKMNRLSPTAHFEEPVLGDLLEQHGWVDKVEEESQKKYQLNYSHLYDYQKIARIVYEEKTVNYERIIQLDQEKSTDGKYLKNVIDNSIITRKKIPWVCPSGVEGSLTYDETGHEPMSLIEVVKDLVSEYKIFTLAEIMADLRRRNFASTILNENSVKIYILRDCVSCVDDAQLYCHLSCIDEFPRHRWRGRNRNIRNKMVTFAVEILRKEKTNTMNLEEMNRLLCNYMELQGEPLDVESPVAYMRARECVRDLLCIEGEKICLTSKALELNEDELENLSVNVSCKPKSEKFKQMENLLLEKLRGIEGHEMLLKDVKDLCLPFIPGKSSSYFYSLIKGKFPFHLERVDRDGKAYLKLVE